MPRYVCQTVGQSPKFQMVQTAHGHRLNETIEKTAHVTLTIISGIYSKETLFVLLVDENACLDLKLHQQTTYQNDFRFSKNCLNRTTNVKQHMEHGSWITENCESSFARLEQKVNKHKFIALIFHEQ